MSNLTYGEINIWIYKLMCLDAEIAEIWINEEIYPCELFDILIIGCGTMGNTKESPIWKIEVELSNGEEYSLES